MDLRKGWKVKFLDHRLEKHILFNVEKLEKYFLPKNAGILPFDRRGHYVMRGKLRFSWWKGLTKQPGEKGLPDHIEAMLRIFTNFFSLERICNLCPITAALVEYYILRISYWLIWRDNWGLLDSFSVVPKMVLWMVLQWKKMLIMKKITRSLNIAKY